MTPQERAAELVKVELDEPYAMYEVILCERVIGHRYHSRERAKKDAAEVVSLLAVAIEAAVADAVRLKDPADAPVSEERVGAIRSELQELRANLDEALSGWKPREMDPFRMGEDLLILLDWQAGLIAMLMRDEPGMAYLEGVEAGRRSFWDQPITDVIASMAPPSSASAPDQTPE